MSRLVRATVLACVLGGGLVGCGSCRETRQGEGAVPSAEAGGVDARVDAGELAARCTVALAEAPLEGGDSLEVGSADVGAGGLAVGVSFGRDGARVGAVVVADLALGKVRSLALGELSAGDAAPLVTSCAACGGRRFVATHVKPEPMAKPAVAPSGAVRGAAPPRVLSIASLDGDTLAPVVRVKEQADESSAFDLLPSSRETGLVAWDEDSDRVVRGIVKVATFAGGKVSEPVVVSPYETDADTPKLVRTARGEVFVAWLAREGVGTDGGLTDADGRWRVPRGPRGGALPPVGRGARARRGGQAPKGSPCPSHRRRGDSRRRSSSCRRATASTWSSWTPPCSGTARCRGSYAFPFMAEKLRHRPSSYPSVCRGARPSWGLS
jgi:hypothetical protein